MDVNETKTWTTSSGCKKKYRDNYFFSAAESSDSDRLYSDAPAATTSQADVTLKEVEKQLEIEENEYNSMLKCMNGLYLGAGLIPPQNNYLRIEDNEVSINDNNYPRVSEINLSLNGDEEKVSDFNINSGKSQCYDFYNETQQINDKDGEKADENNQTSDNENNLTEESNDANKMFAEEEILQKDEDNDEDIQICEEIELIDISRNSQPNLAKYSDSMIEEMKKISEIYQQDIEEISYTDKNKTINLYNNNELFVNNSSGNLQSVRNMKSKKSRSEKRRKISVTSTNKKNSTKPVDDTLYGTSKIRKKKRRVKTTNSKSTTATRDTFFEIDNKKETRKFKPRGHQTKKLSKYLDNRQENVSKIHKSSDVVEIYHNNAINNESLSVVSINDSKIEKKEININNFDTYDGGYLTKKSDQLAEKNEDLKYNQKEIQTKRGFNLEVKKQSNVNAEEIRSKNYQQEVTDFRSGEPNGAKMKHKIECPIVEEDKKISDQHQVSHYDSFATRNYELPTVASKMKRVNRSYLNRFNFRNIPFVVGTSVTPSYNLGTNIQEAFGLMKTRNAMSACVTPLLMNKLRKGVEPVSTLLGDYSEESNVMPVEETEEITRDIKTPKISSIHTSDYPSSCETHKKSTKIIEVTSTKKPKTQSNCSVFKKNTDNQLKLTQSYLLKQRQEELNIDDSQPTKHENVDQNMNGVNEVIINLHDQFEAMCNKSLKLKEKMKKSNDESLREENALLEKELTAKEEEVDAVVKLYREVLSLKHNLRLLHEKNSLVYVMTETPENSVYHQTPSQLQGTNLMFNLCRRNGWQTNNNRGPSTSTRLAGMLRQIKVFQKQLKSST